MTPVYSLLLVLFAMLIITPVLVVIFRWRMQQHLRLSYGIRSETGIDVAEWVEIGGVKQWIHIRGKQSSNPVMLIIHGGPGSSTIGVMDAVQQPLEDYFTVAQWDQRQVGKSYRGKSDQYHAITPELLVNDAEEVVDYLRQKLSQRKVFLLGLSWGSYLGIHLAQRRPECLYAYVGVGQLINMIEAERLHFQRLIKHAKENNDQKLLAACYAIQPYPDPSLLVDSYLKHSGFIINELSRIANEAGVYGLDYKKAISVIRLNKFLSPHFSLYEWLRLYFRNEKPLPLYGELFWKQFLAIDINQELSRHFDIPIVLFSGAHDWEVPFSLADDWLQSINAPVKKSIRFNDSAHFLLNEQPGKFLLELVTTLLPMVDNVEYNTSNKRL